MVVVGTGPSGLVLCLLLARHGIRVECLDMALQLDDRPRATHYGPAANRVLAKAGLLDRVRERGIESMGAWWRKTDGTVLAQILNSKLKDNPDRVSCLPLNQLCRMALEDLEKEPLAIVRWGHRVQEIRQDDDQATLIVQTPEGTKEMTADYVVGCDGANSIIRRGLFGSEFPGYTWDLTIIATNVRIPQTSSHSAERKHFEDLI